MARGAGAWAGYDRLDLARDRVVGIAVVLDRCSAQIGTTGNGLETRKRDNVRLGVGKDHGWISSHGASGHSLGSRVLRDTRTRVQLQRGHIEARLGRGRGHSVKAWI